MELFASKHLYSIFTCKDSRCKDSWEGAYFFSLMVKSNVPPARS